MHTAVFRSKSADKEIKRASVTVGGPSNAVSTYIQVRRAAASESMQFRANGQRTISLRKEVKKEISDVMQHALRRTKEGVARRGTRIVRDSKAGDESTRDLIEGSGEINGEVKCQRSRNQAKACTLDLGVGVFREVSQTESRDGGVWLKFGN